MRMILIGPPASGKGTQAAVLKQKLGIAHISTGDMLRAEVKEKSVLGLEAEGYMNSGKLVPDELVIRMVQSRLKKPDASIGFILDGFPRTAPQAAALDKALAEIRVKLDAVVFVDVSDETVIERMAGRRMDPETGDIYHVKYNPPPAAIAARIIQRSDDNEEAVRKRLEKYHAETEPIIPFYEKLGIIKKINGLDKPENVTRNILAALGK